MIKVAGTSFKGLIIKSKIRWQRDAFYQSFKTYEWTKYYDNVRQKNIFGDKKWLFYRLKILRKSLLSFQGLQGEIKHLYRGFAFIQSKMVLDNGGIMVLRSKMLLQAGGSKVSWVYSCCSVNLLLQLIY